MNELKYISVEELERKIANIEKEADEISAKVAISKIRTAANSLSYIKLIVKDFRGTARWQWNGNGYWECSNCLNPNENLKGKTKDCNPYIFSNTLFCSCCGSKMESNKN